MSRRRVTAPTSSGPELVKLRDGRSQTWVTPDEMADVRSRLAAGDWHGLAGRHVRRAIDEPRRLTPTEVDVWAEDTLERMTETRRREAIVDYLTARGRLAERREPVGYRPEFNWHGWL